jgi:hypothetical protein
MLATLLGVKEVALVATHLHPQTLVSSLLHLRSRSTSFRKGGGAGGGDGNRTERRRKLVVR